MGLEGASTHHTAVLVITDSTAAWGAILRNTRGPPQMEAAKQKWWEYTTGQGRPAYPEYRPREWNQGADALSKGDEALFQRIMAAYGATDVTKCPTPTTWDRDMKIIAKAAGGEPARPRASEEETGREGEADYSE